MAHEPEKRAIVRAAYVHERLPIKEAADRADVSERTAQRWKSDAADEGDDWDKARAIKHMAGEGFENIVQAVVGDFLVLHQRVMRLINDNPEIEPLAAAEALAKLADAFTKTVAGIGKSSPKTVRLAVANEVLRLFGEYVRAEFPKAAPTFVEVLPSFAKALAEHFG